MTHDLNNEIESLRAALAAAQKSNRSLLSQNEAYGRTIGNLRAEIRNSANLVTTQHRVIMDAINDANLARIMRSAAKAGPVDET